MDDYIDRAELLKKQYNGSRSNEPQLAEMVVDVRDIEDAPAADVAPVRHGRNITEMNPVDEFVCSECGFMLCDFTEIRIDEDTHYNSYHECYIKYCPNCGAKMDGGENDGN